MNTALERLRRAKLYGRLHKCEFLKDKVDYLGFEVSTGVIHASPEKVKAMLDWTWPQSVHDMHSYLGFASYYRKFIKGFSQLAKPMTDLTRDKVTWRWVDAETNSFRALKVAMATMARRLLHSCNLNRAITFSDCPANAHRLIEIEHKHDNETTTTTGSQKGRRQKLGDTQTHAAELQETRITNRNRLQVW